MAGKTLSSSAIVRLPDRFFEFLYRRVQSEISLSLLNDWKGAARGTAGNLIEACRKKEGWREIAGKK